MAETLTSSKTKTAKKHRQKPTHKQEQAFNRKWENGGSVAKAMREVGYSPSMSKNPQKLTRSDGWQQLSDTYIPKEKLIQKTAEGLEATKVISANITYGDADEKTNDFIEVPDYATQHKYLQTALEIQGMLPSKSSTIFGVKDGDKEFIVKIEDFK